MSLQVLLVEDNVDDMRMYLRDLPAVFEKAREQAKIHPADTFEKAAEFIADRSRRFDLILSDTYRGSLKKRDVAVLEMVEQYRKGRFCPLIVFSASARPDQLQAGAFVMWADKTEPEGVEKAILRMLSTGVPQTARKLHDELDLTAGNYLWDFLEKNWERLEKGGHIKADVLVRLIRRRAALQLAEIDATEAVPRRVSTVSGLEFYMYPPLGAAHRLGEVIRNKNNDKDIRVVMTPHCFLAIQPGKVTPRADFVQTIRTVSAKTLLGEDKLKKLKERDRAVRDKKLVSLVVPPSGQEVGLPEGRYWYLPAFLEIPHLYCDFMQVESVPYDKLEAEFEPLAVLSPPYAESLQACYGAFYGSVGIPNVNAASIDSLLD
jgi:CheY-like chemotaxis protein